ncbi:hypothetical protein NL676_031359 [Syzygium grande]|nr:hypothetical protein NL676_031359 [Syzygium grande]
MRSGELVVPDRVGWEMLELLNCNKALSQISYLFLRIDNQGLELDIEVILACCEICCLCSDKSSNANKRTSDVARGCCGKASVESGKWFLETMNVF